MGKTTSKRASVNRRMSPYGKDPGLFSKVKNFFKSHWNSSNEDDQSEETMNTTEPSVKPFEYKVPSHSSKEIVSRESAETESTPYKNLSNFFNEKKDDEPLTETEYDRVVGLLSSSRSRTGTPSSTPMRNSQRREIKNSFNSSTITPLNQKILRTSDAPPTVFATPEYRPVYHTIRQDPNSRSIPSVKRVYQFSGLPSPYRTRIKVPSSSKKTSREESTTPNISRTSESSSRSESKERPKSQAANTLLSILDGEKGGTESNIQDVNQTRIDKLKAFANPYASSHSLKRAREKTSPSTDSKSTISNPIPLNGSDIKKSISFNKSEDLPLQKIPSKPQDKAKSQDFEVHNPHVTNAETSFSNPITTQFKQNENKVNNIPTTHNFSSSTFTFSEEINGSNQVKKETKEETAPFLKEKPNVGQSFDTKSIFSFPQVDQISVSLDNEAVSRYRSTFEF